MLKRFQKRPLLSDILVLINKGRLKWKVIKVNGRRPSVNDEVQFEHHWQIFYKCFVLQVQEALDGNSIGTWTVGRPHAHEAIVITI